MYTDVFKFFYLKQWREQAKQQRKKERKKKKTAMIGKN